MNIVSWIMACFSLFGAFDYIIGNKIGIGREFEKGIMLLGTMTISMAGMITIAPLLAHLLEPFLLLISEHTPFDPSVIAGSFLANDMGGASLAIEISKTEEMGFFNGLVVASMLGATISFTLPFTLNVTEKRQHKNVMLGLMCGISVIPLGCFVSGLVLGMNIADVLVNLVPLIVFSLILAVGLFKFPHACTKIFGVFGVIIKVVIIIGLAAGIFEFLTGTQILPYTAPLEEAAMICFNASAVVTGAFPLVFLFGKLINRPLKALGKKMGINETSALGFICSVATSITTFGIMKDMDDKGVVYNSAFAVSAAFTFAGHLAFTLSFNGSYLPAVIIGKLTAGVLSLFVAALVVKKGDKASK